MSIALTMNVAPSFKNISTPYIDFDTFLRKIGKLTKEYSSSIPDNHKNVYSQYFSEDAIAKQMSSMLNISNGAVIGDHGAGTGILGAAVIAKTITDLPVSSQPLVLKAYEIDELLHSTFYNCIEHLNSFASKQWAPTPKVSLKKDFTEIAPDLISGTQKALLDAVIVNPPYMKLNQSTPLAKLMKENVVSTPNIYVVFLVLSIMLLKDKGEMVAIVPRSFCSGDYFKNFRVWLKEQGCIDWFVRYKRRSNLFKGDNVLQENVTFHFIKGIKQQKFVRISLCESPEKPAINESYVDSNDVMPTDSSYFFLPGDDKELEALHTIRKQPYCTKDWKMNISTGKLEDCRVQDSLYEEAPSCEWVPVIYSQHWQRGCTDLNWDSKECKKPKFLAINDKTKSKLIPRGNYILIKRISSNDDRSGRCHVCVVTEESELKGELWAIDNHIQVIRGDKNYPFTPEEAKALGAYLMSETIDHVLKLVSGTTQINKNDLLQLKYPALNRKHLNIVKN
jgi:adenine-specific DNA-methyltransferase